MNTRVGDERQPSGVEITRNLGKMGWVLPSYTDKTREEFLLRRDKLFVDLAREFGGS